MLFRIEHFITACMSFYLNDIYIADPVFLAPMSGISDLPFRRLIKSYGAGLVFSEMIASRAMIEHAQETLKTSENYHEEFPMAVQLVGHDPDIMAQAARMNVERGAAIIDINFGCPVKKVVKKYAGSALMQDEKLAQNIMAAVVKAVPVPVTMKTRLGWNKDHLNAPSLARRAQDVGVQMVTIHGRTRDQMYNGQADWAAIREVKNAVDIPIIANGDILCPRDAICAMEQSGADGVMIGRGAQGAPWLLKQVMNYIRDGVASPPPPITEQIALIHSHYDAILEYYGERKGIQIARKHLAAYCNGYDNAASFRSQINKAKNPNEVKGMVTDFFGELHEIKRKNA